MATVAIISEYNPFHTGHEYQLAEIRRAFGENTEIIAIMSGNYVQRGETAIADKTLRARAALEAGVNLILEIPFPFSMSSAEFYAKSGVGIANALGVVDYISFGSELGDIDELVRIADGMLTDKYATAFSELQNSDEKNIGYACLCEMAYKTAFGNSCASALSSPNNILAIEYIKALRLTGSSIKPHTVRRMGAGYSDSEIKDAPYQSATAIRALASSDPHSALEFLPNSTKSIFREAILDGKFPCDGEKLSSVILSSFLLNDPSVSENIHDAKGGLYHRLRSSSCDATSISELIKLTETKKYTNARIRRAIYYSFFGVTSSEVKELPRYTQLLACDKVGCGILKRIRKSCNLPILTKPSATEGLDETALRQKSLADKADAIFGITLPKPREFSAAVTFTPFVKK